MTCRLHPVDTRPMLRLSVVSSLQGSPTAAGQGSTAVRYQVLLLLRVDATLVATAECAMLALLNAVRAVEGGDTAARCRATPLLPLLCDVPWAASHQQRICLYSIGYSTAARVRLHRRSVYCPIWCSRGHALIRAGTSERRAGTAIRPGAVRTPCVSTAHLFPTLMQAAGPQPGYQPCNSSHAPTRPSCRRRCHQ